MFLSSTPFSCRKEEIDFGLRTQQDEQVSSEVLSRIYLQFRDTDGAQAMTDLFGGTE